MYFAQKCPQNAGNAVSDSQISKYFRGTCPRTPYNCVVTMASPSLKSWLRHWKQCHWLITKRIIWHLFLKIIYTVETLGSQLKPRPHVSIFIWKRNFFLRIGLPSTRKRWNGHRKRNSSRTVSKVEFFENAVFLFSCGRRFPVLEGLGRVYLSVLRYGVTCVYKFDFEESNLFWKRKFYF